MAHTYTMNITHYTCTSLPSGLDAFGTWWLSIGFASANHGDEDVLHVALGVDDEDDGASSCAGLYLERTDQSQGGYGLVERIEWSGKTLRMWLSAEGVDVLGFDAQPLCFALACPPEELAAARTVLTAMQFDGAPVNIAAA